VIGYCGLRLIQTVPPTVEPLTADEVRARLNIGANVTDEVLNAYITAARQTIDGDSWLGRAINTQTWEGKLDVFPSCDGGRIYLPLPPLQQVTVSYLDAAGDPVTMVEGADYRLVRAQRSYIVPGTAPGKAWPQVSGIDGVTIEFVAGYGDAGADVPEPIRTAIALSVGHIHHMASRNPAVTLEQEEGIGQTRYGVTPEVFKAIDDTARNLLAGYQVMIA
jgi:uncharacterized phiE125 gp8 family phage protein